LMMEAVTQLRNLKNQVTEKGHHKVDAFVQWSSDIVSYLQEHEPLIKSLVGITAIEYLREWQMIPEWYQTGLVINITLWVKWWEVAIDKAQLLKNLEKELIDEQGFLQGLRNTLMKPWFRESAPAKVVEAKEAKLDEVKKKIEWIEHELKRLKSGL
jgi:valyl-tRNA synthetase